MWCSDGYGSFGPTAWNSLHDYVKNAWSLETFISQLKSYLFKQQVPHSSWNVVENYPCPGNVLEFKCPEMFWKFTTVLKKCPGKWVYRMKLRFQGVTTLPDKCHCYCQSFVGLCLNGVVCWLRESMVVYGSMVLVNFSSSCCAHTVFACREHQQPKIVLENVPEFHSIKFMGTLKQS